MNDRRGNPVDIAVVVVWRVEDTAQAIFDVHQYEPYVEVQVVDLDEERKATVVSNLLVIGAEEDRSQCVRTGPTSGE